jgi:hypothetical protein
MNELKKQDKSEVSGLCYVDMKESKYVVASNWSGAISVFNDAEKHYSIYPYRKFGKNDPIGSHKDDM